MKEKLIAESGFPAKHFTTVKACGNMKDETARAGLLHSIGLNEKKLVLARQVHGNDVRAVSAKDAGSFVCECDGLITSDENLPLGIFTADCMPVLMVSKDGAVKAAVHAGWKGLAAGILQNALTVFKKEFSVNAKDVAVYIGPHIQKCCYEVSADLENVFGVKLQNGKLDLSEIAGSILRQSDVREVFISSHCSCCENELFFSYRRDKSENRILTFIF